MKVTLNYTSKGLIDAIQRQLAQQKQEGKISGDISYKKIVTCDFWETLKAINDKRKLEKKSKIYHQRSYGCEDKGKPVDWRKTIVVYGTAELEDNEWEMLVNAMGLQITKPQPKEEPIAPVEVKTEEQVPPVETQPSENDKNKVVITEQMPEQNIPIGALSVGLTELQAQGLKDTEATHIMQEAMNLEYKFRIDENAENKLLITNNQGDTVSLSHVREIIEMNDMKNKAAK